MGAEQSSETETSRSEPQRSYGQRYGTQNRTQSSEGELSWRQRSRPISRTQLSEPPRTYDIRPEPENRTQLSESPRTYDKRSEPENRTQLSAQPRTYDKWTERQSRTQLSEPPRTYDIRPEPENRTQLSESPRTYDKRSEPENRTQLSAQPRTYDKWTERQSRTQLSEPPRTYDIRPEPENRTQLSESPRTYDKRSEPENRTQLSAQPRTYDKWTERQSRTPLSAPQRTYDKLSEPQCRSQSSAQPRTYDKFTEPQSRMESSALQRKKAYEKRSGSRSSTPLSVPQRSRRQRPKSQTRYQNNSDDEDLSCPTCGCTFGLQIYQCNRGHSSCETCKESHTPCGICGKLLIMRNYVFEEHLANRKVQCPYMNDGCCLSFKLSEIKLHAEECPYQQLDCPVGCRWEGKLNQLCAHFDDLHPELRAFDAGDEISLDDIHNNSQNVFLLLVSGFHFLFHVKVSEEDRKIYMSVQLISTKISASKWSYEIHVYNKNEYRRKYFFTDCCSSFAESVENIFKEATCSVLPYPYASTFAHNDAMLFKLFIKNAN